MIEDEREKIKKIAKLRALLEKRVEEMETELDGLKTLMDLMDTMLLKKSFKRAEIVKPLSTLQKIEKRQVSSTKPQKKGIPLKTVTGDLLAQIHTEKDNVKILLAEDKNFNVNTPPFTSFFVERVLVKMLEKEADIPVEAVQPKKDRQYHLAQCQAFTLSRRDKETVAMLAEDNWCPAPCIAYGLVKRPDDAEWRNRENYDCFDYGKYIGILTAPLKTASFEPDVVIIYADTNQLRRLLLSMRPEERPAVGGHYFPLKF